MRWCVAAIFCVSFVLPAAAQSRYYDLSKPMTGKSRFVFNADGSPVDLGVKQPATPPAPAAAEQASDPADAAWNGAAAVQDPRKEPTIGGAETNENQRRRGAPTVVLVGGEGAAAQKAQPRRVTRFRFGRRR